MAEKASVAANTVSRFENGGDMRVSTMGMIQKVLEVAGIEFIAENGGGARVRFKWKFGE